MELDFNNSTYDHKFDSIGLDVFSEAVRKFDESNDFFRDDTIRAKLSLTVNGKDDQCEVIYAKIKFDNGYICTYGPAPNQYPQLKIFQNVLYGLEWHIPDDDF